MVNNFSVGNLDLDNLHMDYALEMDKEPKKEGKNFIYNATYSCVLNGKKGSGGIVELKLTLPRKLIKKELTSITFQTAQMIISFIQMKYQALEDEKENTSFNEVITGKSEIFGTQAEKIITFKNFKLAFENMENIK